jgi:hypothetical protein
MKIIYIPLTIPYNTRSLIAMFLTLICLIVCGASPFTADWYHGHYTISKKNAGDLDEVTLRIGPWWLGMNFCGTNLQFGKEVCDEKYYVFAECRRPIKDRVDLTRFGNAQESVIRGIQFCSGWKEVVASSALLIIAAIVGFLTLLVSFLREKVHGFGALFCLICIISSLILFATGTRSFMDQEILKMEAFMATGGRQVYSSLRPGAGLVFTCLACVWWTMAVALSFSLFCCKPKSDHEARAPKIMIVSADRSALGGPMGAIPPPPGFQAVGAEAGSHSQRHVESVDYDDDDTEMRSPPRPGVGHQPQAQPAYDPSPSYDPAPASQGASRGRTYSSDVPRSTSNRDYQDHDDVDY